MRTPWYAGPSLLQYLEQLSPAGDPVHEPLRLPVHLVIQPQGAGMVGDALLETSASVEGAGAVTIRA